MKKNPKTNKTVPVLCGVLAVVLIVMSAALVFGRKHKTAEFAPPPFDATAVAGVPEVPENLGYISPYRDGMGYRFSVCGNVVMEGSATSLTYSPGRISPVSPKILSFSSSTRSLSHTSFSAGLVR